ncbi:type III pantothenate kinase [Fibrivirga algicola]|uniref:Type III pantothenate kinase n=1 Tax=Fibrivirga algicola TaxID=2950420 RepID=A0ABX0QQN3_9BACT|nr:type III pantothenate kinase [Fibrivirga algicola]ARK11298.1 type III pantothenate kinase [Fibrella sp. ES10-3-2-2]NID13172.1 type III pantothenate kinase [Fibrivirga algicola]
MTLTLDIGNSDVVFGLYSDDTWLHIWRTPSSPMQPAAFYQRKLRLWLLEANLTLSQITQATISSVVPALTANVREAVGDLFAIEPVVVSPSVYDQLPVTVLRPQEIGTDLVANAVAAHTRFQEPCVIVDFGTALTFTTVGGDGQILGVAIAPGLKTAIRSLFANTAQLPEVPIELPTSALGQNTVHAIQAGVVMGYEGLVRSLIGRIRAELGGTCLAVATGGLSKAIPSLHDEFVDVVPSLTLDGIRLIGEYARR